MYALIEESREAFDVVQMCRVLGVSPSGCYDWRARPESERRQAEGRLLLEIRAIHRRSGRSYGSPRVWRELQAEGIECSRAQVERLMREEGLRGKSNRPLRRRGPKEEAAAGPVAENVLARRFAVEEVGGVNRVWAGDITYVPTRQGWLYLAVVLDLASRRVVGWSMAATQTSELVVDALEMAWQSRRPPRGLLHHSDRGCQYTSGAFQERLGRHGMQCSMRPQGKLLGQRGGGELLRDAGSGADRRGGLAHAQRGAAGPVPLSGDVVQSPAAPLEPGVPEPGGARATFGRAAARGRSSKRGMNPVTTCPPDPGNLIVPPESAVRNFFPRTVCPRCGPWMAGAACNPADSPGTPT